MRSQFARKKVATGLSAFDQITGGGLPRSSTIVLSGEAGSGKKLLARHLMWNLLQYDAKILYFSIDQSAEELQYYMHNYGWDIAPFEANGHLKIVDVFSKSLDRQYNNYQAIGESKFDPQNMKYTLSVNKLLYEVYDIEDVSTEATIFFEQLKFQSPGLLIFDTVTPLLSTNMKGALQLITELIKDVKEAEATLLVLFNYEVHSDYLDKTLKSLTDALITLRVNDGTMIFLNILKYPGKHAIGPFPLELTFNGVTIIPIAMPQLI